ncbi:MAG: flagellar hook-length control protein FliK [Marinobacter sp.]|uniref:flagellar hook-length control protein FliK n=1 Tax=Marinobacter sp. TaxID=50741 RepID=UPI003299D79B
MPMKLNGGQTPAAPTNKLSGGGQTNTGLPSVGIDRTQSAQQQLAQLKLGNRESTLAKVAEVLQRKGGGNELILEVKGRSLAVAAGDQPPDLKAGDLIKVMRAGNELRLMGKLAASEEAGIAKALAQRLPWQQNLQSGLAQLLSSMNAGLKAATQPGQPPSSANAHPLPAAARQALEGWLANMAKANSLQPGAGKAEGSAAQVKQWLAESGAYAESRLLQTGGQSTTPTDFKLALARIVTALLASQGHKPDTFNHLKPLASPDLMHAPLQFPKMVSATPSQGRSEPASVAQTLRMLAGMLNRITVNQLHSQTLTARAGAEPGAPSSTLLVEIPWLTPQQEPRVAQLRMEQYEQLGGSNNPPDRASISEWRLNLAMDLDHAGPLHFDVAYRHPGVSAQIWAEKQSTLRQVHEELPLLRRSLVDLGLEVTDLECRRGSPRQTETRLEHRLVDTKA